MKIKKSKNGTIKMSAQSPEDSLQLLELVEKMAGRGDDPDRLSLKKRAELEAAKKSISN